VTFPFASCPVKYISAMQLALLSAFDNEVACQVLEALVLTVGVVLGWIVWPAISQKLAQSSSQRKEAALLQEISICDADITEEVENDDIEDEEQDLSRDDHLQVAALFDHYGLFGAPVGAWKSMSLDNMDLEEGCLEESVEESDEELALTGQKDFEVAQSETSLSTERLFEHYGLFGAPVGAWSS